MCPRQVGGTVILCGRDEVEDDAFFDRYDVGLVVCCAGKQTQAYRYQPRAASLVMAMPVPGRHVLGTRSLGIEFFGGPA